MNPTQEQLAELKQIEKEMLRVFVGVCERLHLRYYLMGGTLLGAVRHQGFIPWDDDIDVGMPREDYEVFLSRGQEYMPNHLFIQSIFSDAEYPMCFAKIRNSETTFIETSVHHLKMNHGVYIDIFPLDYYPDDEAERKRFDKKKSVYDRRILSVFNFSDKKRFTTRGLSCLLKLRYPSVKAVVHKRESLYRSVRKSSMIANHGGAWGKKEIMPLDWYGEGALLMFEGMKVSAPTQYHNWLTQVYGDYMQLPPVDKRVSHHHNDVIDLHKSYKEYVGG